MTPNEVKEILKGVKMKARLEMEWRGSWDIKPLDIIMSMAKTFTFNKVGSVKITLLPNEPGFIDSSKDYPENELEQKQKYPCAECGKLRTKDEGGTTFTVCDECWNERHKPKNKPEQEKVEVPNNLPKEITPLNGEEMYSLGKYGLPVSLGKVIARVTENTNKINDILVYLRNLEKRLSEMPGDL